MSQYGAGLSTVQVSSGNVRTTVDKLDNTFVNGNAKNTLGAKFFDNPVTLANPNGVPAVYRYVKYQSTANPALAAAPAPVYWTDNTFTTVTGVMSESLTANAASLAGYLMPNTTDMPTLTAALLNGNFCFIQTGGYIKGAIAPASTAVGDAIIGATGNFVNARVANGTAPTQKVGGWALTALASGAADQLLVLES